MEKLKNYIKTLKTRIIVGFLVSVLISVFEFISIIRNTGFIFSDIKYFLLNIYINIASFSIFIIIVGLITFVLSLVNKTFSKIIFYILVTIYFISSFAVVNYFVTSKVLLDEVLFAYSFSEIIDIINASNDSSILNYLGFVIIPLIIILLPKYIKIKELWFKVTLLFVLLFASTRIFITLSSSDFTDEFNYYISESKLDYFAKSLKKYIAEKPNEDISDDVNILKQWKKLQNHFPEFDFVDKRFPFLHKSSGNNVLGDFFELKEEPPRIVFIIVESLSRSISGGGKEWGSYTPYLDSLAQHSLYWSNCLSTTQRTFGVLPGIFGSLPFGREGFLDYGQGAPSHYTLIDFLNNNGYSSGFSYGGWLGFDKMNEFLSNHDIHHINKNWEKNEEKDRNSWGYNDKKMFRNSMKNIDLSEGSKLDIYLTLSTHSPWDIPNKESYNRKFDELQRNQNLDDAALSNNRSKISSFIFVDEAIEELISLYRKKNIYENTIFVITGDHGVQYKDRRIERYNVPLLIYSPLLKRAKKMKAVVSHRNLTPSFINLLKANYGFDSKKEVSWLSEPIDTAASFRSKGFSPLMQSNRRIEEFVYRNKFLSHGALYEISDNFKLSPINDSSLKNSISAIKDNYILFDKYICENNKIIPDEFENKISKTIVLKEGEDIEFTIEESSKYPFGIGNIKLEDDYLAMKIEYSLDLFIDNAYKNKSLFFIVNFLKKDNTHRLFNSTDILGHHKNDSAIYRNLSFSRIFKKETVGYQHNEHLKIYFGNSDQIKARVKNLNYKIIVIK